ncbi:MAG: NDP-sugar synthase [Dehalococcoidia bacterium]|nr:NDP-sugar synthase [Dehalococcoidia bacterium]
MKAIILVGGEGTRLRPLTCNTPKSMVPVLNRPFLEHVLLHLKSHNVDTAVLALGHLSRSVADYFGDGSKLGIKVIYSLENQPLGTAGPVKLAGEYLAETFLVLNGDVYCDFDITSIVDMHVRNRSVATLTLTPVEDPTVYGVVETRSGGGVKRFVEKPKREEVTSNMINAGLYVLEPEVLGYIPEDKKVMFEHDVFPALLRDGKPMFAYPQPGYWIDIGTPQKYLQVNLDLMRKGKGDPKSRSAKTGVDPTARIRGPVLLPDDCIVGPGAEITGPAVIGASCRIGARARVTGSVLWPNSEMAEGCQVLGSVVANDCHVGAEAILEQCYVSDHVVVAPGAKTEPGTKLWPGTRCEST